jgi:hypothetical protein
MPIDTNVLLALLRGGARRSRRPIIGVDPEVGELMLHHLAS